MVHETESTQMQIRSVDLDNGSCNILSCSPVKEKSNRLNENEGANEVHMVNVSHDIPMDPHTPFTSSLNQPGNQSVGHEQESTKIQLEFIELVKDGDDSIIPISPLVKEKDIHLDEGRNQSGGNITCAVDCDDRQSLSSVRDIIEVCKEDIQIEEVNGVTEKIGSDKLADSSVVLSEELMEDFKVNSNDMVVSVIEPQVVEEGTSGNKGTPHLALSPEVKGEDEDEIENFTFGYCELLSTKRMKGCDENSPPNESENDSNANKSLPSSDYKNSEMQNNQNVSTEFELDTHGNETNVINNKETPQNLQNLGIGNDKVERGMEVTESISSPSKNGTISFVKVISVVDVNIPKIDADDIQIRSQSPASNRSIVSPLEVEFGTGKSEAGSSEFGNPYDQLNPKQSIGIVLGSSETIQLPISDPKSHVDTNTCFSSEKIVLSKENQPLEEISVSDGKEYSSTTSTDASEFFDASDDVVGVIESTEGHGGSESGKNLVYIHEGAMI
ncbi:hypothetical protein ZOSMA_123G00810 [Zostera marina]|uniref:Uncharacterized protein n=1 Tax=Zostera marina TaxID=29655 RepID=A0A0K9Q2L6_ZOSMR|nr:hypothetical protein ZOSMA_123G00810 [Zostera marina]